MNNKAINEFEEEVVSAEVDNSDPYIIIRQEIKKALLSF